MKKTIFSSLLTIVLLVTLFLVNGCSEKSNPLQAPDNTSSLPQETSFALSNSGQNGTTLSATDTSVGFFNEVHSFDWTLVKSSNKSSITVPIGNTEVISYNLTTSRQESVKNVYGITGVVAVTNGGAVATQNLQITIVIQTKTGPGAFQDYSSTILNLSEKSSLAAGETYKYKYKVTFTPLAGATYKAVAKVTITNHSGSLGVAKGPSPKPDFTLPSTATLVYFDKDANIADALTVPDGFNASSTFVPQTLYTPGTYTYTVTLTNNSAAAGLNVSLTNNAVLTEFDSKETRNAQFTVAIYTGDPIVSDKEGCSLSQGFWFSKPGLLWGKTITIGGYTYTQSEGSAIWNTSNQGGIKDSKAGFHQVAAIKLSGSTVLPTASVWNDVAIVESYLSTLGKLSPVNLPTGNQAAKEAAGRIGDWINVHHCN